ncbi:trichohyalin-like [Liolophura sinensis]|uniref:trichohyalin-like n=1 Tax=Liolophura sinensis TaxID=3198878 RepID=UPI003159252C
MASEQEMDKTVMSEETIEENQTQQETKEENPIQEEATEETQQETKEENPIQEEATEETQQEIKEETPIQEESTEETQQESTNNITEETQQESTNNVTEETAQETQQESTNNITEETRQENEQDAVKETAEETQPEAMEEPEQETERKREEIIEEAQQETTEEKAHQETTEEKAQQETTEEKAQMENDKDTQAEPAEEKPGSKLYLAVKGNNPEEVMSLLNSGEDANLRGMNGQTLLHLAVSINAAPSIFTALLDKMDDFTQRDENGYSVLELIYVHDYSEEAENALKAKVRSRILEGEVEKIRSLVLSGWSWYPVSADDVRETSVEAAEFMEKLSEYKEKIASVHKAVEEGNTGVIELLQENKELCEAYDRTGLPPLTKAVILRKMEVAQEMALQLPGSLNLKDNLGRVALHYAASWKDEGQIYQALLDAGAVDTTDEQGHTAMEYKENPELLDVNKVQQRVLRILQKAPVTERVKQQEGDTSQGQTEVQNELEATEATADVTTEPTVKENADKLSPNLLEHDLNDKPIPKHERKPYKRPNNYEGQYLADNLGSALTLALAEIAERRPWDPIEYLAHFLYKFRANMEFEQKERELQQKLQDEVNERENERLRKQKRMEEERAIREEEARREREEREEEERKRLELEEQQNRAKEAILSQAPDLPTVMEETGEIEGSMKDKDETGQSELHRLAAVPGSDLLALLNSGFSLADRDEHYRTPRDIAEEKGLDQNVEILDNYIANMLEGEKLAELERLLLEGYDKFPLILSKVSTEGLPEEVTNFISAIPQLQTKVTEVAKAVKSGVERDVRQTLDRKRFVLAKDNKGRTALHNAVLYDHPEVTEYITQTFPVSVKARDNLNRTPLHYAAALSDDLFDLLVEHGADLTVKDVKGKTPSDYKEDKGEIIKLRDETHDDDDDDDDDDNSNEKDNDNTEKDADNNDHTEETNEKEDAAET